MDGMHESTVLFRKTASADHAAGKLTSTVIIDSVKRSRGRSPFSGQIILVRSCCLKIITPFYTVNSR